jgi:poly(3-hydroxybutyrate) depolymerase
MPLVIAFHAAGNPNTQLVDLTNNTDLQKNYVMAFPKSQGNEWSIGTDGPRVDAWYDDLLSKYCIDKAHVFATGHSSGAQMIVQLMCKGNEKRFHAIAPVASSNYCASWPAIPSIVIHGKNDQERGKIGDATGTKDLAAFTTSNACSMDTMPLTVPSCMSSGMAVSAGCRSYSGCSQPTEWCQHDDPFYSSTNHGWPCFASNEIAKFFGSLP